LGKDFAYLDAPGTQQQEERMKKSVFSNALLVDWPELEDSLFGNPSTNNESDMRHNKYNNNSPTY